MNTRARSRVTEPEQGMTQHPPTPLLSLSSRQEQQRQHKGNFLFLCWGRVGSNPQSRECHQAPEH